MRKKPTHISAQEAAKLTYNLLAGRTTNLPKDTWLELCSFFIRMDGDSLYNSFGELVKADRSSLSLLVFRFSGHKYLMATRIDYQVTRVQLYRDFKHKREVDFNPHHIMLLSANADPYGLRDAKSDSSPYTRPFINKFVALMSLYGCPVLKSLSSDNYSDDMETRTDKRPVPRVEEDTPVMTYAVSHTSV